MNRDILILVGTQFLSAFGDNAILFTVIAMTLQSGGRGAWYITPRSRPSATAAVAR